MGRSWTLKSRLHENEIFKGEFCTSISLKIVKTTAPSMSSSDSITEVVARTFSAKTQKRLDEERGTVCFQSRLQLRQHEDDDETKYQTSHGQNLNTSSFSFSEN